MAAICPILHERKIVNDASIVGCRPGGAPVAGFGPRARKRVDGSPRKGGDSAFLVTKTANGAVVEAPSRDEFVVEVDGEPLSLRIDAETALKADKGADVKDARNVSAADLKKGQPVRVKYRPADETAVEVRILKSKT